MYIYIYLYFHTNFLIKIPYFCKRPMLKPALLEQVYDLLII